jgi:hypothetical protein
LFRSTAFALDAAVEVFPRALRSAQNTLADGRPAHATEHAGEARGVNLRSLPAAPGEQEQPDDRPGRAEIGANFRYSAASFIDHGRCGGTVPKSTLEGKRTGDEHELVERLHAAILPEVRVVLWADRGFGDQKRYALLGALG